MIPALRKSVSTPGLSGCLLAFALGTAWGGPSAPAADRDSAAVRQSSPRAEVAAFSATDIVPGAASATAPAAATSDASAASEPAESIRADAGSLGEHAPLALFSLGALGVGGIFYGINSSMHRSNVSYTAGDRSQLTTAAGVAGVTALLAAGSYFFYAHQAAEAREKARDWDAQVSGGVSPAGGISVAARVSLPLPSLSR